MRNRSMLPVELIKIATDYGIDPDSVRKFARGSAAYAFGSELVLKSFPGENEDFEVERAVLHRLHTCGIREVPEVRRVERLNGVDYAIFSRLPGEELIDVWGDMSRSNREELCFDLGKLVERIHSVDPRQLPDLRQSWSGFLEGQLRGCRDRHASWGMGPDRLPEIDEVLGSIDWEAEKNRPVHILHTELMRDHVMVEKHNGRWRITGIFDFGDAIFAPREYEFVSAGCLLGGGEPGMFSAFLEGYGYDPEPGFVRKMTAYLLIHRYGRIEWIKRYVPPPVIPRSLSDLGRIWYEVSRTQLRQ